MGLLLKLGAHPVGEFVNSSFLVLVGAEEQVNEYPAHDNTGYKRNDYHNGRKVPPLTGRVNYKSAFLLARAAAFEARSWLILRCATAGLILRDFRYSIHCIGLESSKLIMETNRLRSPLIGISVLTPSNAENSSLP